MEENRSRKAHGSGQPAPTGCRPMSKSTTQGACSWQATPTNEAIAMTTNSDDILRSQQDGPGVPGPRTAAWWVTNANQHFPGLWAATDRLRATRGANSAAWPDHRYLPYADMLPLAAAACCASLSGPKPVLRSDVDALMVLAAWRVTQGIY